MSKAQPSRLRGTTSAGRLVGFGVWFNADLIGREHPVVLDIANPAPDGGPGLDSWYFSPAEALRLADLLEQAAQAAEEKTPLTVGAFANPDIRNGKPLEWLVVEVAAAGHLRGKGLRVRLAFDDPLTRETPGSAALWLTPRTSRQTARCLREAASTA